MLCAAYEQLREYLFHTFNQTSYYDIAKLPSNFVVYTHSVYLIHELSRPDNQYMKPGTLEWYEWPRMACMGSF
jgi:hypothetical protein